MAWDTKYRPRVYKDVVGQDHIITVLREYVRQGKGLSQSVLFAGSWGTGKTSLARIYARALLCKAPVMGEPCDQCPPCLRMLRGSSDGFVEMDAATHSSKADIKAILEEIEFHTISGSHRIYLIDESHRLSKDALDALLKALEDTIPGTDQKRLVCLFCTTEPEKMRTTVLSRCAPAFMVKPMSPEALGERLAFICEQEGVLYEQEALQHLAYATECHVRDAIKALEGVALSGEVSKQSSLKFLQLDTLDHIYALLEHVMAGDLQAALEDLGALAHRMSPGEVYRKLLEVVMVTYQMSVCGSAGVAPYFNQDVLERVSSGVNPVRLLQLAQRIASVPQTATVAMLKCDLALFVHGDVIPMPTPSRTEVNPPVPITRSTSPALPTKNIPTLTLGSNGMTQLNGKMNLRQVGPEMGIDEFQTYLAHELKTLIHKHGK